MTDIHETWYGHIPLEDTPTSQHFNFSESLINRRPLTGEAGVTPAPVVVGS